MGPSQGGLEESGLCGVKGVWGETESTDVREVYGVFIYDSWLETVPWWAERGGCVCNNSTPTPPATGMGAQWCNPHPTPT